MKKAFAITLTLLISALATQAQTATTTTIRIILQPEMQEVSEWEYYFYSDVKGVAPVLLTDVENVLNITAPTGNVNGYIYAKNTTNTKQTNNFAFNLKGKPVFIVVKNNTEVIVNAKRMKPNKYMLYRNEVTEGERKPW